MMQAILRKSRLAIFAMLLSLAFFLIISCNELPTELGSSLLLDTVQIYAISSNDTNLIEYSLSDRVAQETINQQVLLIGISGETKSVAFVRYVVPDSTKSSPRFPISSVKTANIISAQLEMPLNRYTFGDSLDPSALSFDVFPITQYWENKLSWDSVYSGTDIGSSSYYNSGRVLAQFNQSIIQSEIFRKDSSMTTISIDIDKSFVEEMLANQNDTNIIDNGIAFIPKSNSKVIRQFNSEQVAEDIYPTPHQVFREHRIKVVYEFNSVRDTIYLISGITKNISYSPPPDQGYFAVQGAVFRWGIMKFDLRMLPKFAAIHRAEMVLRLDRSKCEWGNFGLDSVIAGTYVPEESYKSEGLGLFYALKDSNDIFQVRDMVGAMRYYSQNNGFGYALFKPEGLTNNIKEIDRMVFYGLDHPDISKRPYLKVIYSTRPKFSPK